MASQSHNPCRTYTERRSRKKDGSRFGAVGRVDGTDQRVDGSVHSVSLPSPPWMRTAHAILGVWLLTRKAWMTIDWCYRQLDASEPVRTDSGRDPRLTWGRGDVRGPYSGLVVFCGSGGAPLFGAPPRAPLRRNGWIVRVTPIAIFLEDFR